MTDRERHQAHLAARLAAITRRLRRLDRELARWDAIEGARQAGVPTGLNAPAQSRNALEGLQREARAELADVQAQLDQAPAEGAP